MSECKSGLVKMDEIKLEGKRIVVDLENMEDEDIQVVVEELRMVVEHVRAHREWVRAQRGGEK